MYPDHPSSLAYTDPLPSLDDFGVDDGLKTGDQGYGQDVDLFSDDVIVGTPPSVSGCSALEVGNCQTHLVFITIKTVEVIKLVECFICLSDDPLSFHTFSFFTVYDLTTYLFQEELNNHRQRIGQAIQDAGGALKGQEIRGGSGSCSYWYIIPAIVCYIGLAGMTVTG